MVLKDKRILAILRFGRKAYSPYKGQILLLAILGFFNGILGGIGVNAVIPLLGFITGAVQGQDVISKAINKVFAFIGLTFNLKNLLLLIIFLFVFKALTVWLCSYLRIRIRARYAKEVRWGIFSHILASRWPFLKEQKVGHFDTILIKEVDYAATLLSEISNSIIVLTSLFVYVVIAFSISKQITLLALALGAALFLIFKPLVYRTRVLSQARIDALRDVGHFMTEHLIGIKTIKAMALGQKISQQGKSYFDRLEDLMIKTTMLKDIPVALLQPISVIFICLVFGVSYKLGNFNFAAFVAILYLVEKIFAYFQNVQASLHKISENAPYLRDIVNYQAVTIQNRENDQGRAAFQFKDSLAFEDVAFAYQPSQPVLAGLSFTIKKGQMVGLIGPSGAGKTTIVDLLLRLFTPQSGRVLLDGNDVGQVALAEWRRHIGYVSQDIFLLNETIENNIKFYNASITEEKMIEASKTANIYDFIKSQSDGFQTIIGERGTALSNGQRQRVILARVLAQEPDILVLDEATSALDNESELLIQEAIKSFKGRLTIFMIAHRLSSVTHCDNLLVLKDGQIIEQGKPADLLAKRDSYFHQMHNLRQ